MDSVGARISRYGARYHAADGGIRVCHWCRINISGCICGHSETQTPATWRVRGCILHPFDLVVREFVQSSQNTQPPPHPHSRTCSQRRLGKTHSMATAGWLPQGSSIHAELHLAALHRKILLLCPSRCSTQNQYTCAKSTSSGDVWVMGNESN